MRPIAISLSPNLEIDDSLLAIKTLFSPWKWVKGSEGKRVEGWFRRYFDTPFAFSFNSGRCAQYLILKSLGVGVGDEVLLQAFTCVAVPNAVIWTGAKPVYVDIDRDDFNIDVLDLERKITPRSKAIIVQHTFGIAAKLDKIKKLAKKKKLFLIEDCAHSLGGNYKGRKLGTYGDAAFFSFGRDKAVSSVFGGMAITKDKNLAKKMQALLPAIDLPKPFWVLQQLIHPVAFLFILPLYNIFNFGKLILVFLQKLHLLSFPVAKEEKIGGQPSHYPQRFPNGLAVLSLHQLKKLTRFNNRRVDIAKFYENSLKSPHFSSSKVRDGNIFLRYPVLIHSKAKRDKIFTFLRKKGILIGDWYSNVVDPKGANFEKIAYVQGSCPMAEWAAEHILNLPTYPTLADGEVKKIVRYLQESASHN